MKWKALLAILFMPVLASAQVNITEATYWFDDNLASAVTVPIAAAQQVDFNSSVSTAGLSTGPHLVTIRFRQSNGKFSAPITKQFMKVPSGNGTGNKTIVACQYWFDNNYAGAITQAVGPAEQLNTVVAASVAGLPKGPHIIHMRFRDNGNIWSGTMSQQFFKTNGTGSSGSNVMTAYRYWVDTAVSQMRTGYFQPTAQNGYLFTLFNFSALDTGKHWVHYQFKDTMQVWSSVVSDSFVKLGRPRIDYITPNKGGNKGNVTVSIFGNGLFENARLRFTKAGQPDIVPADSVMMFFGGRRIDVRLNLKDKAVGKWNVVVEIPADTVMVLEDGFLIESGRAGELIVGIVGSANIRRNTEQDYTVVMENVGNNDANQSVVWIYTPPPSVMELKIKDTLKGVLPHPASTPVTVVSDTPSGKMATPIIPRSVAPGQIASLRTTVKTTSQTPFTIEVGATKPIHLFGFENPDFPRDCMLDGAKIVFKILGETIAADAVGCFQNVFNVFEAPFKLANNEKVELLSFSKSLVGMFMDCGTLLNPEAIALKGITRLSKFQEIYIQADIANDLGNFSRECLPLLGPEDKPQFPLSPVAASDPNAKYGLVGYGSSHYFNPTLSNSYLITFENEPVANAPAQVVSIVDTLDMSVFDQATFSLGSIVIAEKVVEVPSGSRSFTGYIDYRPDGNNLVLQIDASLNDTTGVATWLFTTLDPETEQPTTNPIAGFLPPNVNSPEGQGSVFFTIKTKDGLPTNTVIKNKASIYFDNNAPIVTEPWINTIDISAPGSEVAALPEYTKDTVVNVRWSGRDTGAGIRDYTIYVSENGNPYRIWKFQTTDTAADFIGQFDSTYAFYSVATDHVGNKEKVPTNHDAVTRLIRPDETVSGGISVFPNPTSGTFTIQGRHEREQHMSVTVTNITGQLVQRDEIENIGQPFKKVLDLSRLSKGYYNVTLRAGTWKQVFKLIKL